MDSILVARIEQRLVGLTRLGNKGAKWIGATRFAAQSPASKLYRGYLPSRSPPANSAVSLHIAEKVRGCETSSGFEVEPDVALVELQTRVEGPPGF
jgi:hypothetical protein